MGALISLTGAYGQRVEACVRNAPAKHAWIVWLDRKAIFKSLSNRRVEEKCNNTQIANQKGAVALDALRHLPTCKVMTRERSSKNNPQGLK